MSRFFAPKKPILGRSFALVLAFGAPALAESATEIATTRRVCSESPAQAVARAQRARGTAGVEAARVLPNPSLVVEHNQTLNDGEDRETIIGLSVPLGIGGRRFLLQDAAAARRDRDRAGAQSTLFDAALLYRTAFARAVLNRARLRELEKGQRELDSLVTMVAGLSAGGESAGYDLARLRLEAQTHRRRVISQKARIASDEALLSAWLDGPVSVSGVAPTELAGGSKLDASGTKANSREVAALKAEARAQRIEVRAANRRWVPDLQVFAGYRQVRAQGTGTGHGVSLGLDVPIVLFDHGQGVARRAEAEAELAGARASQIERDSRARFAAARARLDGLGAAKGAAEAAATESRRLAAQARELYAAGESSVTELIAAERDAESAALTRIDTIEELVEARLAMMRAAGTLFEPTLDRACGGSR